jgi:hypothetical protein
MEKAGAAAEPTAASGPRERALVETLTETRSQLADTQAQVADLVQRLSAAEAKLAAPKAESRAMSAPDAALPSRAADPAARLLMAQSALAALNQGTDANLFIGGLERMGGDPDRLAQMRAGQSAPGLAKLTADFSALSDQIIAAAAPPPSPDKNEKSFGEKALTYLQAHKLVKVHPVGSTAPGASPEEAAAAHVAKAIKSLKAGDLAGAVAEEAQLPAASRAVSADWAKAANARLGAERAARAEFEAALQNVGKTND